MDALSLQEGPDFVDVDPIVIFGEWLELATRNELNDPNAMALATSDQDGLPNVRMVLLKEFGRDGFVFYTNRRSCKGAELSCNMQAAAVLHWKSLGRQVRIRGTVEIVEDAQADAYFASRAPESRVGAWASKQSQRLDRRSTLERAVERVAGRFNGGEIPRPRYWGGYRIHPVTIEFWLAGAFRLHDRVVFRRRDPTSPWIRGLLYP